MKTTQALACAAAFALLPIVALAQDSASETVDVLVSVTNPRGVITVNGGQYDFGEITRSSFGETCYIRSGATGPLIEAIDPGFNQAPIAGECEAVGSSIQSFNILCSGSWELGISVAATQTATDPAAPTLGLWRGEPTDPIVQNISTTSQCNNLDGAGQIFSLGTGQPVLTIGPEGGNWSGVVGNLTITADYQ